MLSHEVAKALDITTQTLYNWLKKELIPEPVRHPLTNYRLWTAQDVDRIRSIISERRQS